jgi:hypothetical protein
MSDSSYNAFYPIAINGLNNLVNSIDSTKKTSLKNFGKSELMGDVYIDNGGRLAINKAMDTSNTYYLDVSGNANFNGDLILGNKNTLAKTKSITTSTTLQFGDPEYITIASACVNNSTITLPSVNNTNQLGTKFTFFYADATTYPGITISTASGQTLTDNVESNIKSTYILGYFRTYVEMVCVSTTAPQWAISNGNYDYDSLVFNNQDNVFTGDNTFPTQLTTDNSQKVATTQYVKSNLSSYQTTIGMSSYAPLSSPALTGNPTTTTQLTSDNSTRIASTAYVKSNLSNYQTTSGMSNYALLDSPTLTGTPHAPTTSSTANSTRIATTAFVKSLNYATTTYADGLITTLLGSANYWTNENHYDDILPQSILEPTSIYEFVVKGYVDNNFLSQATAITDYLSIAQANSTFQPISAMGGYLLTATANSTYAPISNANLTGSPTATTPLPITNSTRIATTAYVKTNLNSYLLSADATSTYATISSLSNYVLTSYLNANYVNLSSSNTMTGNLTFNALTINGIAISCCNSCWCSSEICVIYRSKCAISCCCQ